MNIIFDPLAPNWVIYSAIAVAGLFASLSLWRHWQAGIFRLIAMIALIALLLNPQWRQAEKTPLEDIAIVLVDQSASQTLADRQATTRAASAALQEKLAALGDIDVRITDFGGEEETLLMQALRTALADAPRERLGAVFIVSDGQIADDAETARTLGLDAPVHVVLTGGRLERDRKITLINAPRYGIVRQSVRISFRIDDLGMSQEAVENPAAPFVILRIDGKQVLRQRVQTGLEAGFDAPLDRPGAKVIELEVETLDGELTHRNNIAVLPITAIRDRLRVLLISGEPHTGERVWRNLLKSDPAVDLVHFTILRPIEKNDNTPVSELALIPFPQDELFIDKLREFDLLIFDRYTYRGVLSAYHFDNIARFVEQGGAVLISSGPEFNGALSLAARRNLSFILPAAPVGPAHERPFRPMISEAGRRHPVTADLPEEGFWGRWLRLMPVTPLRGEILMIGPQAAPLLMLDRVGEGRVGLFLSDHVWLWARGFDGGGPHAELLRRIAHWLMKEPELEEEALRLQSDANSLIIERRSMDDNPGPVVITAPDGETRNIVLREISPGRFERRIENAPRGLYRAASGELFAVGAVGLAAPPEFQDVISTDEKIAPIVEMTNGGIFSAKRNGGVNVPDIRRLRESANIRAASNWAGFVERKSARIDSVRTIPAAHPALWLFLLAASLFFAWRLEGRSVIQR